MAAEALTYDDIYELLRIEKNNADLQELQIDKLNSIKRYFAAKTTLLDQQAKSKFASKQKAQIILEIENARQALYDLFDKRQRKIINSALYAVRTESRLKDTTNMLPSEEKFYLDAIGLLELGRSEFEGFSEEQICEELKAEEPKAALKLTKIKALDYVPVLIDSSLNKYGPLEPGQNSELPPELADILVKQGKAEMSE